MPENLYIFIDSFPFASLDKAPFLQSIQTAPVKPGLGYSINVKAEIFGGYRPDDVGYFCEWRYEAHSPLRKWRWLFSLLRPFDVNFYASKALRRALRKLFQLDTLYIPFKYCHLFSRTGTEPYKDDFPLETVFSKLPGFRKVCYYQFKASPRRDEAVFDGAVLALDDKSVKNLFIAFADLDSLTHTFGVGSSEHDAAIARHDRYLRQLYEKFKKSGGRRFVFLSDHGMANVTETIRVGPEDSLGPVSDRTYTYFIDLTMIRMWIFDENLLDKASHFLESIGNGHALTEEERTRFGVTSRKFGDIIYLLDEGKVFVPNFFGQRVPKAMHGYTGTLPSQFGVVAADDEVIETDTIDLGECFPLSDGSS